MGAGDFARAVTGAYVCSAYICSTDESAGHRAGWRRRRAWRARRSLCGSAATDARLLLLSAEPDLPRLRSPSRSRPGSNGASPGDRASAPGSVHARRHQAELSRRGAGRTADGDMKLPPQSTRSCPSPAAARRLPRAAEPQMIRGRRRAETAHAPGKRAALDSRIRPALACRQLCDISDPAKRRGQTAEAPAARSRRHSSSVAGCGSTSLSRRRALALASPGCRRRVVRHASHACGMLASPPAFRISADEIPPGAV